MARSLQSADKQGNLPMSRVKYDAKADYEYLENFKILQACFKRNGVDKVSWFDNRVD